MYGSERYAVPLPRPFPLYVPRPSAISGNNKLIPARMEMDDYAYRPELPQSSSTDDSGENKNELLSSEMREFSSCFTSYVPPIASPSMPCFGSVVSEQRLLENEGSSARIECDGAREDECKREREHKKRSKNWTRLETLKLIRERSEIDAKFRRAGRKSELWDAIAESLHRENFVRDAQQCKDKWEKLSAGFKEVRDGIREKEDFPYYDELQLLSFERSKRKDRDREKAKQEIGQIEEMELEMSSEFGLKGEDSPHLIGALAACGDAPPDQTLEEQIQSKKRKKPLKYVSLTDLSAVQELMETLLAKQQKFFMDLFNAVEKREQMKEKIRQEREDRWRAEEREQRRVFNNAMIILAQKVLGEHSGPGMSTIVTCSENVFDEEGRLKKRSKNWKWLEVSQLINLRMEMNNKFATPARRVALWEELAEILGAQGIQRDGKQCREKWDKLMAEFKDVTEGKRDQSESPFYQQLKGFMDEGHGNA